MVMRRMLFGFLSVMLAMTVLVSCAPGPTPTPVSTPGTAVPTKPPSAKPTGEATKPPTPSAQTPKPPAPTPQTPKPGGAPYYQGKVIDVLCESAAGGGTDTVARITAAVMPKYIPGNPKMIVRNQGGGAGSIANNSFYEKAKPDGFALLQNSSSPISMQLRSRDVVKYDLTKYKYVGNVGRAGNIIMIRKGLMGRLTDPKAEPLVVGTKEGEETWQCALLWGREFLGWNLRWVPGFGGTSEIELAFTRGEVDVLGTSNAFIVKRLNDLGTAENICAVGTFKPGQDKLGRRADFPNLPAFDEVLGPKKPSGIPWQAFINWLGPGIVDKNLAAPPGTPDDIMAILRDGFAKASKDAQFDDMMKKSVNEVYDIGVGQETWEIMNLVLNASPEIVAYTKTLQEKAGLMVK